MTPEDPRPDGRGARIAQVAANGAAKTAAKAAATGLASGTGFVLPILTVRFVVPGQRQTILLLLALLLAVLLVRRLGRLLHRLLDRADRKLRFPLLALYAAMAMVPPVSLLLLPGPHG